jgi:acyl carrier protein
MNSFRPEAQPLATARKGAPAGIAARTLTMEEIRRQVSDYILAHFLPGEDPSELTEATPLITGGILDSIATLKLVVFLEDRFGITVEAHEAGVENLDSVARIADLIARKKAA